MDKKKGATTKNDSDFEHLKVWKNNSDLDYYMSEEHWNFHVNQLLYAYLTSYYEGNEVCVYINLALGNGEETFSYDYNEIYGVMFNEAYSFCSYILTTPVPEIKIAFLENKAETLCPDSTISAKSIVAYHILVMTGLALCLANDQNDTIDRFLNRLAGYNHTCYFGGVFHHFENYIERGLEIVAGIMTHGQLLPLGKLRSGYDYKGKDDYLRKKIVRYKYIADKLEINSQEITNNVAQQHGEHYRGKNVCIFHENLDTNKIASAIIAINRNGIPVRNFCLILHSVFTSLNGSLTVTTKSKFIDWIKFNCKIYFDSTDLKGVKLKDKEELKIEEYKAIFADKQMDGRWIFNKKFYKIDLQGNPLQGIEKRK